VNRTEWNKKIDDVVAGLDGPYGAMSAWMDGYRTMIRLVMTYF